MRFCSRNSREQQTTNPGSNAHARLTAACFTRVDALEEGRTAAGLQALKQYTCYRSRGGAHCSRPSGSRKHGASGSTKPTCLNMYSMFLSNEELMWLSNKQRRTSHGAHVSSPCVPGVVEGDAAASSVSIAACTHTAPCATLSKQPLWQTRCQPSLRIE